MPDSSTSFGLSCPSGGDFYICEDSKVEFLGCCTKNPCADGSGSCPKADLRNSSFSADKFDHIPPQDCAGGGSALWYTCKENNPPFMGCCESNPCAKGSCPKADLFPAKLSADDASRSVFLSVSSTPSSTTATGSPTSTHASGSGAPLSKGAIAGIAVGGVVVVIAIIAGCAFMFKRGRRARDEKDRDPFTKSFISSSAGGTAVPSQSDYASYRDTYHSDMPGASSPPLSRSSPPSWGYDMQGTPYRGSTISNISSQGYHDPHSRTPSQLSEMNPNFARFSAQNPNLEPVSELEGPDPTTATATHELSGGEEARSFRRSAPPPSTSPLAGATPGQHDAGSAATRLSQPGGQTELHMWGS